MSELALLADAGIGQPDRRQEVAVTEHRKNLRVDLVGLAGQRRETLDLLGVSDLDRPALLLEGVVDDPCASRRRAVRRAGPDALPDRRAGKRRASFGLDRVQRATLKWASSVLVFRDTTSVSPQGAFFMAVRSASLAADLRRACFQRGCSSRPARLPPLGPDNPRRHYGTFRMRSPPGPGTVAPWSLPPGRPPSPQWA